MRDETSIELTAVESCWLLDRVKTTDTGTQDQRIVPYRTLERLGSVFLELTGENAPDSLAVVLTEAELWWCKDRVSPFDVLGSDKQFGVRLLQKIMTAVLSLQNPELPDAIDHTEPDRDSVAAGFQRWLSDQSARYYGGPPL